MLTRCKHIALLGVALAAAPAPSVAAAARHKGDAPLPRVRLRAEGPPASPDAARGEAGSAHAIDGAEAVGGPLLDPVDRFSSLIAATTRRTEHRQKVEARKEREAREAERLAQLPGGVSIETLEAIAACESGGDPAAISPDGTYRGKYQFDQGTWESVGGSGDPAQAPEAEQDYRAALLYAEAGSSPWPICG